VRISCYSTTQVIWSYPNNKRVPWEKLDGNVLVLTDTQYSDTGNYTCQGTTMQGDFEAQSELLVASKKYRPVAMLHKSV